MQMIDYGEHFAREFVNRKTEWKTFNQIVIRQLNRCFFCVEAKDGFGKTWLLHHLRSRSKGISDRKIFDIFVDLDEPHAKDAEELLRYIAKKVDGPIQDEMTRALTAISQRVIVQAEGDVNVDGDIIGGNKIIVPSSLEQDNIHIEVRDPYSYRRNVEKLQNAFCSGLNKLQPDEEFVIFLDNFGRNTTDPTCNWLIKTLAPMLQRREISNLIVVFASSEPFHCFEKRDWRYVVTKHNMGGIPDEFIREYWVEKRNLDERHLETIIPLLNSRDNSPTEMSSFADAFDF